MIAPDQKEVPERKKTEREGETGPGSTFRLCSEGGDSKCFDGDTY